MLSRADIKERIGKVSVNLKKLSEDDLIKYNCHQASQNSEAEVSDSRKDEDEESLGEEATEPYGINYKECDICYKVFTSDKLMKNHRRVHSGVKLFLCEYCGHLFALKCNLQ